MLSNDSSLSLLSSQSSFWKDWNCHLLGSSRKDSFRFIAWVLEAGRNTSVWKLRPEEPQRSSWTDASSLKVDLIQKSQRKTFQTVKTARLAPNSETQSFLTASKIWTDATEPRFVASLFLTLIEHLVLGAWSDVWKAIAQNNTQLLCRISFLDQVTEYISVASLRSCETWHLNSFGTRTKVALLFSKPKREENSKWASSVLI